MSLKWNWAGHIARQMNVGPTQLWIGDYPQKDLWEDHQNVEPLKVATSGN